MEDMERNESLPEEAAPDAETPETEPAAEEMPVDQDQFDVKPESEPKIIGSGGINLSGGWKVRPLYKSKVARFLLKVQIALFLILGVGGGILDTIHKAYLNPYGPSPVSTFLIILVGSLIISFVAFVGPIAVFRYSIKKEPVSPRAGLIITLIYGVVGFVIFIVVQPTLMSGGVAIMWSLINYILMTDDYVMPSKKQE